MDLFDQDVVMSFLNDAMRAKVSQELFVWGIIWFMVQKKIAKHFGKIESSLSSVANNLNELKESLVRVENSHSERLTMVETRITKLETKE